MCQIAIDIPNEVLFDTRMSKQEANSFAKKAVALCYYVQNGVSLGYCAQIAGMSHYYGYKPKALSDRLRKSGAIEDLRFDIMSAKALDKLVAKVLA